MMKHIYTILVVYFGWVIFRVENMSELTTVLFGLFGIGVKGVYSLKAMTQLTGQIYFLIVSIVACTQFGKIVRNMMGYFSKSNALVFYMYSITEMLTPVVLLILSILALIGNSYNPFLYFQF